MTGFGFWSCVVLTFFLCFTSSVYVDQQTGMDYSAVDALFKLNKEYMSRSTSFFWYNIFSCCIGKYLTMLMPIITAFPFIPNFCSERNSGLIRYTVSRTGKFRYCFSKFITALAGGGIAVLFGTLLFGVFCYIFFLKPEDYSALVAAGEILSEEIRISAMSVKRIFLGRFLFGAVSVVPAFLLSAFIKNRYIITCIPFMAMYMYSTLIIKLSCDSKDKVEFMRKYFFLFSDSLLNYWNAGNRINLLAGFNVLLVSLSFLVFYLIFIHKTDVGQ